MEQGVAVAVEEGQELFEGEGRPRAWPWNGIVGGVVDQAQGMWAPPSRLTVSEWADRERVLSPEHASAPGKWHTDRAEYLRGMMDAFNDPTIETIVFETAAQVGKTSCIENILGYVIDMDPSPVLIVQPTLEMGQTFSKDRLAPMLRDTQKLSGKVADEKSKIAENTIMHKVFPGGHLTICGANSAASLASRPIKYVFCDEIDKYPLSAGPAGDPVNLAFKRAETFWNRKLVVMSTPLIKDESRIDTFFEVSDKRYFFLPCPKCGTFQKLEWDGVRWDQHPDGTHDTETAGYVCADCKYKWDDAERIAALRKGEWRPTVKPKARRIAGFHLSGLYSPWRRLQDIVDEFLVKKKSPDTLKTFVNETWAQVWDAEGGTRIDEKGLIARCEAYPLVMRNGTAVQLIPDDVVLLTCGVDVQDDRIEAEVVGWGVDYESWSIDVPVFHGDPSRPEVWHDLDVFLDKEFEHETGIRLKIACSCIDTGGHFTQEVYGFVKPRQYRRIFAIKGSNQPGKSIAGRPTTSNIARVKLFPVGTDTAKQLIYGRLKVEERGPSYCHFPTGRDAEYFEQLTSEKLVNKWKEGKLTRQWVKKRPRNEALDMRVYATAALYILNPDWTALAEDVRKKAEKVKEPKESADTQGNENNPVRRIVKKRRSGWVNNW